MADTRTINEGTFSIVLAGDYILKPSMLVRIRNMVLTARRKLALVVTLTGQSQHEAFRACMGAYFRVPAAVGLADYNRWVMRLVGSLRELNDHLKSPELTIHSAIGQHEGMEDASAYVMRNDYLGVLRERVGFADPHSRAGFHSDIYMNFERLGANDVAAANLVHEACHRYLGARDWAYLPNYDMISYVTQWAALGVPVPFPPKSINALKAWPDMTVDEALNNADSYGGFVSGFRIPL
jgi:hypothetical protein